MFLVRINKIMEDGSCHKDGEKKATSSDIRATNGGSVPSSLEKASLKSSTDENKSGDSLSQSSKGSVSTGSSDISGSKSSDSNVGHLPPLPTFRTRGTSSKTGAVPSGSGFEPTVGAAVAGHTSDDVFLSGDDGTAAPARPPPKRQEAIDVVPAVSASEEQAFMAKTGVRKGSVPGVMALGHSVLVAIGSPRPEITGPQVRSEDSAEDTKLELEMSKMQMELKDGMEAMTDKKPGTEIPGSSEFRKPPPLSAIAPMARMSEFDDDFDMLGTTTPRDSGVGRASLKEIRPGCSMPWGSGITPRKTGGGILLIYTKSYTSAPMDRFLPAIILHQVSSTLNTCASLPQFTCFCFCLTCFAFSSFFYFLVQLDLYLDLFLTFNYSD